MRLNRYFTILAGSALLFSCQPQDGMKGYVFHERNLVSIEFERQIGEAVITDLDEDTGLVEVKIAVGYIDNLASVSIKSLVAAYGSTSSAKSGDTMDFTGDAPTFSITSQAGETRTYTVSMTPFSEDFEGNYAITGSMLIGGLGADDGWGWGTMGMGAPEDRPWCWDTNGYGPAANYDNYLEIVCTTINDDGSTEGTCVNYGGADGKHWNCIIYKADAGLVTDVHKYYRVIPIGESRWKRNYTDNTITFTAEDGRQTVCSVFEGTVVVSASHSKSFDIPSQALGFAITGDYTWDDSLLYTDYQKFGVAARYCFLMVNKVDEIPAGSKIIGDEGEINIPEPGTDPEPEPEPEPGADFSAYAGEYKIKTVNLFGGVDQNGFINIKDKPWDWTGYTDNYHSTNADKEYDNTLTITIEGAGGTLNYGPGADGEYWDYVYTNNLNSTNGLGDVTVDMSFNFGLMPQGESSFTLDPATMAITITAGSKTATGKVLGPGTETYANPDSPANSATLTIPSGCIAIVFKLTKYSGTDFPYQDKFYTKDIDRIVYHPYYYAMIFEKQ